MSLTLTILLILISLFMAGLFATLTYSLRDFSRPRLSDLLERRGKDALLESTIEHSGELAFITASARLLFNLAVLLGTLYAVRDHGWPLWVEYASAAGISVLTTIIASVTIPHALAQHLAEQARADIRQDLRALDAFVEAHGSFAEMVREHYATVDGDAPV